MFTQVNDFCELVIKDSDLNTSLLLRIVFIISQGM